MSCFVIFSLFTQAVLAAEDDFINYAPEMESEQTERVQDLKTLDYLRKTPNIGNGNKDNLVIVEPRKIVPVTETGRFEIVPYRLRKSRWGSLAGVSYNLFRPDNYQLDQLPQTYSDFYPSSPTGLINVEFIYKRNFRILSFGVSTSIGHFKTKSDVENFDSTLSVTPIKLGLFVALDSLFSEPWVVPFFNGGVYTAFFSEKTGNSNFSGNTQVAFHGKGGLMFQLDWLDRSTSHSAYHDSGIENTFLYVAFNFMTDSVEERDPRLGTSFASAGLTIEF